MQYEFGHNNGVETDYRMSTPIGYGTANSYRLSDPAPAQYLPCSVLTIINACGGHGTNRTKASAPSTSLFTHEFILTGTEVTYTNGSTAAIEIPSAIVGGNLTTTVTITFTNCPSNFMRVGNTTTGQWTFGGTGDDDAWESGAYVQTIAEGPTSINLTASNWFGFYRVGLQGTDVDFLVSAANLRIDFDGFSFKFYIPTGSVQATAPYNSQSSTTGSGVWMMIT